MLARSFGALGSAALLLLTGCGSAITTPDAMREYVRGGRAFSKMETFEVKRPYAAVAQDLKRRSEDCLDKTFQITKFVFYVADVTPKGRGATSIDLYGWTLDRYRWAETAVKAWARGEDPGCPTLQGMY